MKHFLCLAFGLLMACAVHAADDVGMKIDQSTVTITVPDFCAVADMPALVLNYDNMQTLPVMVFATADVAPVKVLADHFTLNTTYGRPSKLVAAPRSPITSMQYRRFVPPNAIYGSMIRHCRNYGHNH